MDLQKLEKLSISRGLRQHIPSMDNKPGSHNSSDVDKNINLVPLLDFVDGLVVPRLIPRRGIELPPLRFNTLFPDKFQRLAGIEDIKCRDVRPSFG
jgi:hypothetical protein